MLVEAVELLGFIIDVIVIGLVLVVTVGLMLEAVEVVSGENKTLLINSGASPQ